MPLIIAIKNILDRTKKRKLEDVKITDVASDFILEGGHITATEGADNTPSLQ